MAGLDEKTTHNYPPSPFSAMKPVSLPWITEDTPLPHPSLAWGPGTPAPGLLAAGADLTIPRLREAYGQGTFPWYSEGQPVLWWCTQPRMVLSTQGFRLHRSLRKTLQRFRMTPGCEIRIDSAFERVIARCSGVERPGQNGSWIVPDMVDAYVALHRAGDAHSVETWIDGELVGGLYLVALGQAIFGESMFSHRTDASKIALAALVGLARHHGIDRIDCQQQTEHLASLGAKPIPINEFLAGVAVARELPSPRWEFSPVYWDTLLSCTAHSSSAA
jgi:leucyl/phenylalanyl-tRNA--protein transferase